MEGRERPRRHAHSRTCFENDRGTDYGLIRTGETLALPIALGLGVILASLTFTDFYLSGDQTAWSEQWGPLETLEPGTEGFPFGA